MNEFTDYTDRVTLFEDGAYRWHYDMDMYQNKSMLVMLEKINLFTFLGVSVGGAMQEKNELDMHDLVKEAEAYMYKDKRNYYEQFGHDRRRRTAR